jgi:two-component system, NtrC family, sensor histidine kinase HydH
MTTPEQRIAELEQTIEALTAERDATLKRLAQCVGNELRNPMAAVQNAHHYIARRLERSSLASDDPKLREVVAIVDRELRTAARVLDDLLDFSRPRAPSATSISLHDLVRDVVAGARVPPHVVCQNDVPIDFPLAQLDREMTRRIVGHLVQNACEAIPPGRAGKVRVDAEARADRVLLRVTDDGVGIPRHELERVCAPLFTTKVKGTGLGLAVVVAHVARQGGTLSIESEVDRGATFTATFPQVPGALGAPPA